MAARLGARGRETDRRELAFGAFGTGRYAWRMADQLALPEPIPFKGRQEPLYELPADVRALVEAQLGAEVAR